MIAQILLVATLAVPIAMLLACLAKRLRSHMPDLLVLAPLPGLAAALLAVDSSLVLQSRLQVTLALEPPAALLLGVAALLWSAAGFYARTYMVASNPGRFAVWWLLTLTGSLGVFVAADLASFYLTFGLASLAAWGLVVHDGTARAQRAGEIYLVLAILGEICLLIAFALLAAATPGESLAIREVVAALPVSPWPGLTLALLIVGFGLKMGLVPLHVWLPLAHPAAPMPASAVLSGVIVKAGVIGLIRFLPSDIPLPDWSVMLASVGLLTAYWGVALGITQRNPKTVLAYSTVSQMGLVAAVLGMGLAAHGPADMPAAFYAAHHILAKGGLFLAVGVAAATGGRRFWLVLLPAAILALGFGGLPLTGGYVAKLAVKDTLGDGLVGLLATLAGAGSTLLMLHFLRRLRTTAADGETAAPAGLVLPWLAMALAAVVLPWLLFPATGIGSLAEALAPAALWEALWPVLLGIALFALLGRFDRLPELPEGDIVVLAERMGRVGPALTVPLARAEIVLQRWPVAGGALLALMVALGIALLLSSMDARAQDADEPGFETLSIPFPFYNESFGFAAGYVYGRAGWPEPQARVLGSVMAGTRGSGMALLAGQDLRTPWLDRLFIDPFLAFGYFGEIESFTDGNPEFAGQEAGTNSSSRRNYIKGDGFDTFLRTRFHYLLPIGDGREQIVPRYELEDGIAVGGFTGASSLNPLKSGRSFIDLRPFYRSQNIENNQFSSTISTNGIDLGLTWDNRDFPINPARGQSVTLAVSRDFGLFDSSDSWTVLQGEVDQYFELGELPHIRQSVLALAAWTAGTPSWKQRPDGTAAHRPPAYAGATLGGLWRMRAYPSQRFNDRAAIYYAAELRVIPEWNPFDAWPAFRSYADVEWLQFVPFVEVGRVAPEWNVETLHSSMKWSAGVGIRALASGFVVRVDTGFGEEGGQVQMMIGQPFQFF